MTSEATGVVQAGSLPFPSPLNHISLPPPPFSNPSSVSLLSCFASPLERVLIRLPLLPSLLSLLSCRGLLLQPQPQSISSSSPLLLRLSPSSPTLQDALLDDSETDHRRTGSGCILRSSRSYTGGRNHWSSVSSSLPPSSSLHLPRE